MIRPADIPEWVADALCAQVDPALFHPAKGQDQQSRTARNVCAGCDALDRCAEYAIARPELDGIWGGMTKRQRDLTRRSREVA